MTVEIGTKFRYSYADGRPEWTVKKARGAGTWECVVEDDMDWTGAKKVFGTEEIESALNQDRFWNGLMQEHGDWWSGLKEGEIVHYHNGFGQYVRGRIAKVDGENKMIPTALVGAWREYDLPRRARDGSINYGYHVEKIMSGEAMQPNASNMFESDMFSRDGRGDPRKLPEIDLSVPEMDDEAAAKAKIEKARMDAIKLLQEGHNDPMAALLEVQKMIAAL